MNQLYAESDVTRKNTMKTMVLRTLMILGMVVGFFLVFFAGIFSVIGIVLIVAMLFLFPKLNVEYEYVFVDGQLDFDRITGKSRRKTMLRIDFEQVEIMAPMNSHTLDAYQNIQCEKKDYSSGVKSDHVYVIIASHGDKKLKVLFEPDEKMMNIIKQKSPRKVISF
jgi:hypothetical protein